MNEPKITAIINTYNRKDYLRKAIESLLKQTLARDSFEVLIVDNGSVDGTSEMIAELQKQDPNIRYTIEPTLGLSHARNRGWREATTKYVAYLDDDELVAPDWLETILHVFERTPQNTGCIGGKVLLLWESPRPAWVPNDILYYLGHLDLSDKLVELRGNAWLGGGNSAFRREALAAVGGFDTRLGRKGNNLLSMEDTLIQKQIMAAGFAIYYHPGIVIHNTVQTNRITQEWFKKRAFWEGVSEAISTDYAGFRCLFQIPHKLARSIAAITLKPKRLLDLITPTTNPDFFLQKCIAYNRLGFISGTFFRIFGRHS